MASAKRCCGKKWIFEHPKTVIENDDSDHQFTDIALFGPSSGDFDSDQEHSNEDMAIEYGPPGEVTGERDHAILC